MEQEYFKRIISSYLIGYPGKVSSLRLPYPDHFSLFFRADIPLFQCLKETSLEKLPDIRDSDPRSFIFPYLEFFVREIVKLVLAVVNRQDTSVFDSQMPVEDTLYFLFWQALENHGYIVVEEIRDIYIVIRQVTQKIRAIFESESCWILQFPLSGTQ